MFQFRGRFYAYADFPYNTTRLNERAVEVAVGMAFMRGYEADTLEIGAVLPHYLAWDHPSYCRHVVVDRDERWPDVINEDVLTYIPARQFQRVLSISTLEHLGSAEAMREAVERLRGWTQAGGRWLVTVPAAWPEAPYITPAFLVALGGVLGRMDKLDPDRHGWIEVDQDTPPLSYDGPTRWANTVYLLEGMSG